MTHTEDVSIDELVGENIHRVMWKKGIPQTRMAVWLGMSQGTLSKKLHGKSPWMLAEIQAAAARLDHSFSALMPSDDELPHLDSNQEPCDYHSVNLTEPETVAA